MFRSRRTTERASGKHLAALTTPLSPSGLLVDGDHHVGGLDDDDGRLVLCQTQGFDGFIGEGIGSLYALGVPKVTLRPGPIPAVSFGEVLGA